MENNHKTYITCSACAGTGTVGSPEGDIPCPHCGGQGCFPEE